MILIDIDVARLIVYTIKIEFEIFTCFYFERCKTFMQRKLQYFYKMKQKQIFMKIKK